MGTIRKPHPVKLFAAFIFKEEAVLAKAKALLSKRFGAIEFESETKAFSHTRYYEEEFGAGLKRQFISFRKLIRPEQLADIKLTTNRIEARLSGDKKRTVNIDPGYIDLAKCVLASTKDYKHRIYAGKGIYTEVTLFFQGKTFQPWEWTYPDYRSPEYISILNSIRELYAKQIKDVPILS